VSVLLAVACAAAADPFARGVQALADRKNAEAVTEFTAALAADPKLARAHDRRGDAYLKLGKFADAVADFDAFLKAEPAFAPEHWRRGIALYYAGRHADGVKQFDTHKTVNPEDVENAAWHYLCNAKVVGKEKARAALITVTRDRRVPMAEVQKLYAGKLQPKDVLAAADAVDAKTEDGTEARFYANLYVGLWYEAEGDAAKAKSHLTTAAEKYKIGHYMWDVANAHVGTFKK
jgi:lipoprotein NlpI